MPWSVKTGVPGCDGFAVVKYDGETVACHASKSEAEAHVRALYASETTKTVRARKSELLKVVPNDSIAKQILESVESDYVTLSVVASDGAFDVVMSFDKADTFKPPAAVRAAGRRAQEWIRQGFAGDGFTNVGRARAAQLANGESVSLDVVRRMASYFRRHVNDPKADNFDNMSKPSPGRVAWDAWGGYAGRDWANAIERRYKDSVEKQAMDDESEDFDSLNMRQKMMYAMYESIAEVLGEWDMSDGPDGLHYIAAADNVFAKDGIACMNCVFYEGNGVCEVASAPVEPLGACKLWIIPSSVDEETVSPTVDDTIVDKDGPDVGSVHVDVPLGSQRRNRPDQPNGIPMAYAKEDARRYTLAPMYVPNRVDAHGDWTDSNELQPAVWDYVRSGDRTIRLQHNRDVAAGEWVEIVTWPYEVTVPMTNADGTVRKMSFPAETVFMGIVWNEWAWDLVKTGRLRGLSIGGKTGKVLADLPEQEGQS